MLGRDRRAAQAARLRMLATKSLVAFLTFLLAFGTTPAQLWADGAEGIAQTVGEAAAGADVGHSDPDADDASVDGAPSQGDAATAEEGDEDSGGRSATGDSDVSASNGAASDSAGGSEADDGSAGGEDHSSDAASSSDSPAKSKASAPASAAVADDADYPSADSVYIHDDGGSSLSKTAVGQTLRLDAAYADPDDDWDLGDEVDFGDGDYAGLQIQWYMGDSKVSYAYGAAAFASYAPIDGATGRTFTVTSAQLSKYLAARVTNPDGTEVWVTSSTPQVTDGKTELTRASVSGKAKVGQTLAAIAYEEGSWDEEEVTGGVTYRWLSSSTKDGAYEPIAGQTASTLALTEDLAGRYIKVEVTSRNTVTSEAVGPVVKGGSAENEAKLSQAIKALEDDGWSGYSPDPKYGTDTNLNDMIEARLAELGYGDVSSRVTASGMDAGDPAQTGSIDASEGTSNGDIAYFFLAPDQKTSASDYSLLRQFKPTYRLTVGDATDTYTPSRASTLAWDEDKVQGYLEGLADEAEVPAEVADGSVAEGTASLDLPGKVESGSTGKKVAAISWESSDPAAAKVVEGYDASDYSTTYTVKFTHQAAPVQVTLTATYELSVPGYGCAPSTTLERAYTVDIAPRSEATEAQVSAQLQKYLDKVIAVDFATGGAVDAGALTGDIQLSTPRSLGLDGKYYKLSYSSSNDGAVRINGYRGYVTGALEGDTPQPATITASLTYDGVTATRELGTFTPAIVTQAELERAAAFMGQVKAQYAAALLGANADASSVTSDLEPFMSASQGADGSISWARTALAEDAQGIQPVNLPGYDSMSGLAWRTFRSSRELIVKSENLRVVQPVYNTQVTVDSALTYKKYESLAAAHPDNALLQKLVNQPVSATFTVRGTAGKDSPDEARTITVNAKITGISEKEADGSYTAQAWIPLTEVTVRQGDGATAEDIFEQLLDAGGYTYEKNEYGPTSITSPDGRTLDSDFNQPYRYWSFYVNGAYGQGDQGAATSCVVTDGMTIELRYLDEGGTEKPATDVALDPDASRPGWGSAWPSFTQATVPVTSPTPSGVAETKWLDDLSTGDPASTDAGYVSDPILVGGYLYVAADSTLYKKDPQTGETLGKTALATSIDSVSRMVYADGVIVVPLSRGRLQAITPDALATVWLTEPLGKNDQSLGTLAVRGGYVYASTSDGSGSSGTTGHLFCVNLKNGAVRWSRKIDGGGFYWGGSAVLGDALIAADDAGNVYSYDPMTGETRGTALNVGAAVRSTPVVEGDFVYVVSKDGVLHKLSVGADGSVSQVAQVKFAYSSTSTPAFANGKIFVGGVSEDYQSAGRWMKYRYARLCVIDADTLALEHEVERAGGDWLLGVNEQGAYTSSGDVKSTPVVSVQGDQVYAYFTTNYEPGGVYRYRLGDDEAVLIYTPDPEYRQYCNATLVAGEDGTLYYRNDSGALFALQAADAWVVKFDAGNGDAPVYRAVARGGLLTRPSDPEREGYRFAGWFTDPDGGEPWDFGDPVSANMTLYGRWTRKATPGAGGGSGNGTGGNAGNGGSGNENGGGAGAGTDETDADGDGSTGGSTGGDGGGKVQAGGGVRDGAATVQLVAAASDARVKDGEGGVVSDAGEGEDGEDASAALPLSDSSRSGVKAAVSRGAAPFVALAAGVLGVAGLIAAGLWSALSKRR